MRQVNTTIYSLVGNTTAYRLCRVTAALWLIIPLILLLGFSSSSVAAIYTVTKIADTNGTCTVGDCSLREAISAANSAADLDVIDFVSGTNGQTIAIASSTNDDTNAAGDFDITNPVQIVGNGSANTLISAALLNRIFHVTNSSAVTIEGVTLSNGKITANGGCIYATSAITIKDSIISACTATTNEGGGVWSNGLITIDNVQFLANTAGTNGGAIRAIGLTGINGVTFTDNYTKYNGGAIYNQNADINLDGNLSFTNNDTDELSNHRGGAIWSNRDVTLNAASGSATFADNRSWEGGAVYLGSSYIFTASGGVSLTANRSMTNGGAIYAKNITITGGATFSNNYTRHNGGALFNASGAITLDGGVNFTGNTTDNGSNHNGGVIWSNGTDGHLSINPTSGAAIIENNTSYDGGAFYLGTSNTFTLRGGVTFTSNTSSSYGGAFRSGAVDIRGGITANNNYAPYAGGVFISDSTVNLDDGVNFNNNRTDEGSGHNGGAFWAGGAVTLNATSGSSIFELNRAYQGGAIEANLNSVTVTGGFTSLTNTSQSYGGAIHASGINITGGASFTDSYTRYSGGALFSDAGPVNLDGNVIFINNDTDKGSGHNGGAIWASGAVTLNATSGTAYFENNNAYNGGAVYTGTNAFTADGGISFLTNTANAYGGALYSGTASMNGGVTLTGNTAGIHGGGVYASGYSLSATGGITASNNTAVQSGGALLIKGGTLTDVDFTDNSVGNDGGAIFNGAAPLVINGTSNIFLRNYTGSVSTDEGGSIYSSGELRINNATFASNNDGVADAGMGGAIFILGSPELTLIDSTFSDFHVSYSGGAILMRGGTLTNITVSNSHASDDGGAIWNGDSALTINGTNSFLNNYGGNGSGDYGGTIFTNQVTSISNATFTGNNDGTADAYHGGAIFVDGTADLTLTDTTFSDFHVVSGGGAIVMRGGLLTNISISNSHGADDGGGIYNSDSALTIVGTNTFSNNYAGTGSGDYGGTIYTTMAASISNASFTGNNDGTADAFRGGAILVEGTGDLTLTDTTFSDFHAISSGGAILMAGGVLTNISVSNSHGGDDGGAIYNGDSALTIIGTNTFSNNYAGIGSGDYGGTIYSNQAATIDNSTFVGNGDATADAVYGGAIHMETTAALNLTNSSFTGFKSQIGAGAVYLRAGTIKGSTFENNSTVNDGGAVYGSGGGIKYINNTFSGNSTAGGAGQDGGAIYSTGTCTIKNSTFYNNTAGIGEAIYGNTCTAYNTLVVNPANTTSLCQNVISGGGNIHYDGDAAADCFTSGSLYKVANPNLDILLKNNGGPTYTHAIPSDSAAVSYAIGSICTDTDVASVDQRGVARTTDCDSGAVEYALVANTPPVGGYTVNDVIPAVQITQSADGDGLVTIRWKGKDFEDTSVTLNGFQYSVDGGLTWNSNTTALSANWGNNGGAGYTVSTLFSTEYSFTLNTKHADVAAHFNINQSDVQIRFRLNDGDLNSNFVVSESFQVDNVLPNPVFSSAIYVGSSNTLTITGSGFNDIAADNVDVTNQVDWSKFSWDVDGDSEAPDVSFVVGDVTSLTIDSDISMTLLLASAKATAIEAMPNYASTGGEDTLDISSGFSIDAAGNVSTTDAAANVPLYISEFPALIVTKSEDTDGNCTLLNCSLREAVKAANASPGASIIKFQTSTNGSTIAITRAGTDDTNVNGDFDITNPVYIIGNGSVSTTISGGLLGRVFHITNASAVTIDGATVTSGSVSGEGGCIYTGDTVVIRDSTLTSCMATSNNGGALYAVGEVLLDNVSMDSNIAGLSGGGIYAGSIIAINGVTFTNNQAEVKGGGIYSVDTITIEGDSLFDLNKTTAPYNDGDGGGAIYAGSDVTLNAASGISTFTNNSADEGGAIFVYQSYTDQKMLTMTAPVFVNNSALYTYANGGALKVYNATINEGSTQARFEDNNSYYSGGAVDGFDFIVYGESVFHNNSAGNYGGALNTSLTIFYGETTFTDNRTINNTSISGARGGAVYNRNRLTFEEYVLFENNQGQEGGAIHQLQFQLKFKKGATFRNNSATQFGGAIALMGGWADLDIDGDVLFEGNTAGTHVPSFNADRRGGGAIFAFQSYYIKFNLNSGTTLFQNNVSDEKGGAIFVHGINKDTQLYINNTAFKGNVAKVSGGAIDMRGGTITSSTFSGNSVDGGIGGAIYNTEHPIKIINSTISENSVTSSGEGGALYFEAVDPNVIYREGDVLGCDVINSTIYNNSAVTANDSIRGDPGFACTLYNTIVAHPISSSSLCSNVTSGDYNLHYNGTCFTAQTNDRIGDPVFGALANNGGPTETHAIGSTSDARDNALGSVCIGGDVNAVDQRGEIRTSQCDIGAYEYYAADGPDHFLISHDGYGIYCDATEVITVTPKEIMGSDYPGYNKTIVLDTQTGKGSWTLSSGTGVFSDVTANDGLATYTFTGSEASASFELTYQEGGSTLDIDVYEQANNTIRDNDAESILTYLPSGFTITNNELFDPTILPDDILAKNQNADFTIHLTAYGATANDTTCGIIEGYTGIKSLKFWSSATGVFTIDTSAIAATEGVAVGQNVNFTDGKAQVTGNYDSTGSISLNVKDDAVADPNLQTGIRGESNLFDVNAVTLPWNTCDHEATPFACFNFYSLSDFSPLENTIEGTVGVAGTYAGSQMTLQNIGSQEFVLLVGGDATIGSGAQSEGYEGGKQDVGGNITYTGGAVLYNDVHSGGSITAVSGTTNIDGSVYAATTITEDGGTFGITGTQNPWASYTPQLDFTIVSDYFQTFSTTTGALANTTVTTDSYGALSTSVVSGDNVTSIDAATLLNAYRHTVTGPCDAVLYINVTGSTTPTIDNTDWIYSGGIDRSHVLLNFPNASTLTLSNGNQVNMLAPYTTVTALGGWVQGNLIVGNMINDNNVRLGHFTPTFNTCLPPPTLNYFLISHDGAGIHCSPEVLTVTPKQADGSDFIGYTGTIVLDTQEGTGTWSTSAPGAFSSGTDGIATYTFTGSETDPVSFTLDYTSGDAAINIAVYDQNDTSLKDNNIEGDLIFSASGFTVTRDALDDAVDPIVINPIPAQIAGTTFDMHITAYGTTATDQTCGVIENYEGTPGLDFWYTLDNPTSGTIAPTVGSAAITTTEGGKQVTVAFTSGRAVVPVTYKDVGQITIDLKDAGASMFGTSQFVVRPADLVLSDILMPTEDGNCAGGGGLMTIEALPSDPADYPDIEPTFAAGEGFCVTATAVDSEGTPTPSFGQEGESIKLTSNMVAAGGGQVNPAVTAPTGFTFNAGVATSSDISWGEVGIIKLSVSIDDGNYLGTGDVTGAASVSVGRFKPADFLVEYTRPPEFATACADGGFTYIGQSFVYATKPEFTVTARNASEVTTRNYNGDWFKLKPTSVSNPVYTDAGADLDTNGLPDPDEPTILNRGELDPLDPLFSEGVATVTFNNDVSLSYTRALPIVPFDAAIEFSVVIQDEDAVEASVNPFVIESVGFDSGASMVYGRVKIGNVLGSELLDLNIPVVVERFSAANVFEPNVNERCISLTLDFDDPDGPGVGLDKPNAGAAPCVRENIANPGESGLACTDPVAAPNYSDPSFDIDFDGDFNVWLTAPGATGSLDLTTDGLFPWLMFDWNGDGNDDQPRGRASFGVYRGDDLNIFIREVY